MNRWLFEGVSLLWANKTFPKQNPGFSVRYLYFGLRICGVCNTTLPLYTILISITWKSNGILLVHVIITNQLRHLTILLFLLSMGKSWQIGNGSRPCTSSGSPSVPEPGSPKVGTAAPIGIPQNPMAYHHLSSWRHGHNIVITTCSNTPWWSDVWLKPRSENDLISCILWLFYVSMENNPFGNEHDDVTLKKHIYQTISMKLYNNHKSLFLNMVALWRKIMIFQFANHRKKNKEGWWMLMRFYRCWEEPQNKWR